MGGLCMEARPALTRDMEDPMSEAERRLPPGRAVLTSASAGATFPALPILRDFGDAEYAIQMGGMLLCVNRRITYRRLGITLRAMPRPL